MSIQRILIIALAATGKGISGGDRIFIELARNWSKKNPIYIYLWTEGYEMCQRQYLVRKNIHFMVSSMLPWKNLGFAVNYIAKIIEGIRLGLTINLLTNYYLQSTIIYSSSDFWMDAFPCVILKIRNPKLKWVATWYQTAPNLLKGFNEQKSVSNKQLGRDRKYFSSTFFYWFSQLPIKPLIKRYADKVIVNNEEERKQFVEMDKKGRVVVLIGAVRLEEIKKYQSQVTSHQSIKFDAVFQGRFHPQKGVVELIDIWKKVVEKIPNAKLAMIGDGSLMEKVKSQITRYKLQNNVKLFGYVFDGPDKYKIFSQSKIVVHPAFYDSGGMASAEAMAFGLPCVGFDLISYKSYYPKGMLKVKKGDIKAFSDQIIELLHDEELRNKIGKDAYDMINKNWSWEKRADEIYSQIIA